MIFLEKILAFFLMKITVILCLLFIVFFSFIISYVDIKLFNYNSFENLRGVFFASFFAIGSFLFTLITSFLFNIKEKLFDNKFYKRIFFTQIKKKGIILDDIKGKLEKYHLYFPLKNCVKFFIISIFLCYLTSFTVFLSIIIKSFFLNILSIHLIVLTLCYVGGSLTITSLFIKDNLDFLLKINMVDLQPKDTE